MQRPVVGMAGAIHVRCIHGILGREITKHTVVYSVRIHTVLANPTLLNTQSQKDTCECFVRGCGCGCGCVGVCSKRRSIV